jgi:hypothetical protein
MVKLSKLLRNEYDMDGVYVLSLTNKIRSDNTSGYKGVSYAKKKNCWRAVITLKGKTQSLGSFKRKEDAIKARKRAEEELFDPIIEKFAKRENS